jgi:hypothetical protein
MQEKRDLSLCVQHMQVRNLYCANLDCSDFICTMCMPSHPQHLVMPASYPRATFLDKLKQRLTQMAALEQNLENIRTTVRTARNALHDKQDQAKDVQRDLLNSLKEITQFAQRDEAMIYQHLLSKLDALTQHTDKVERELSSVTTVHNTHQQQLGEIREPSVLQMATIRELLAAPPSFEANFRALEIEHAQLERSLEDEKRRPSSFCLKLEEMVLPNAPMILAQLNKLQDQVRVLTQRLNEKDKQIEELANTLKDKGTRQDIAKMQSETAALKTEHQTDIAELKKTVADKANVAAQNVASLKSELLSRQTMQQHDIVECQNAIRTLTGRRESLA